MPGVVERIAISPVEGQLPGPVESVEVLPDRARAATAHRAGLNASVVVGGTIADEVAEL